MKIMCALNNPSAVSVFETEVSAVSSFQRILLYILFISFAVPLLLEVPIGDFRLPVYVFDAPLFVLLFLWYINICIGKAKVRISLLDVVFVLFLAWIFVTACTGLDPLYSLRMVILWVRAYLLFTLLYNTRLRKNDLLRITVLLLFTQIPVALLQFATQSSIGALNQYFGQKGGIVTTFKMGSQIIQRVQGTFPNSNMLALWLILLLPIVQSYWNSKAIKKSTSKLLRLLWFGGVVVLLLTLSRAGIAAGIVGFTMVMALTSRYNIRRLKGSTCRSWFWLLLAVSAALLITEYWFPTGSPLVARFSILEDPKRAYFLEEAIHMISEHPLLGVGYDNFVLAMPTENLPFVIRSRAGVHNIPLRITAETGIPGGILFMFLIALLLRRAYSSLKHVPTHTRLLLIGMVAGIISCAIMIQFNVVFNHHSILPLFFALTGAILGLGQRALYGNV